MLSESIMKQEGEAWRMQISSDLGLSQGCTLGATQGAAWICLLRAWTFWPPAGVQVLCGLPNPPALSLWVQKTRIPVQSLTSVCP